MKYVLFVCTHNAGRSQIAQAFFERYAPDDLRAESAGQEPAAAIWPTAVDSAATSTWFRWERLPVRSRPVIRTQPTRHWPIPSSSVL